MNRRFSACVSLAGLLFLHAADGQPPVDHYAVWLDAAAPNSMDRDFSGMVREWHQPDRREVAFVPPGQTAAPKWDATAFDGEPGVIFSGSEWLIPSRSFRVDGASDAITVFAAFQTAEEHPLRVMALVGNGGYEARRSGVFVGIHDANVIRSNNALAVGISDGRNFVIDGAASGNARPTGLNLAVAMQFPLLARVAASWGQERRLEASIQGDPLNVTVPIQESSGKIDLFRQLAIGAADSSGAHRFSGVLAELLIYPRLLDADEISAVEQWMIEKYDLESPSEFVFDPRVRPMELPQRAQASPGDGTLIRISGGSLLVSDDGKSWQPPRPIAPDPDLPDITVSGGLLDVTPRGTLIAVVRDPRPGKFVKLLLEDGEFSTDARSPIYAFRSEDGKTWTHGQHLQDAYSGAMRDMIVTRDGNIVAVVQAWDPKHERHVTVVHTSNDDGKSYQSTTLDNQIGHGYHDGFFEATVTELTDGGLWLLARTSQGVFWESRSKDGGTTWSKPSATRIEAGSYPGFLLTLESGRLVLAWNRPYPDGHEGRDDLINIAQAGLYWGVQAASRFNRELSIMFSDDDGKTWSDPTVVIAGRQDFAAIAYPYLLERTPGEIFIWAGRHAAGIISEKDFVTDKHVPSPDFRN